MFRDIFDLTVLAGFVYLIYFVASIATVMP